MLHRPEAHVVLDTWSKYMKEKLKDNEWKGHWRQHDPGELLVMLLGEIGELILANSSESARKEAADVANFAFMYADTRFPEENSPKMDEIS